MDYTNLSSLARLKRAYGILEKLTPLGFDCGLLCNKRCCKGGTDDGMHLYPGEEILLSNADFFREIRSESLNGQKISYAICKGKCKRTRRPLACRIFPLVPYISEDHRLYVIEDPRARYFCPLVMNIGVAKIRRSFRRQVYYTFRMLIEDPKVEEYILNLSFVLKEYAKFTGDNLDNIKKYY